MNSVVRADDIDGHPNAIDFRQILSRPALPDFKPTGVSRNDYLKLISDNVDFFKNCQNANGAIIDPVSKGERQYSTPAFALASALLVKEAKRTDLLSPSSRAMSYALTALLKKEAADGHSDFYIPMLVHTYRLLKEVVPAQQANAWADQFRQINPETVYRTDLRGMNWNIVSSSGELLRRQEQLVANDQLVSQMNYLEQCLAGHLKSFTSLGLAEDPGAPMAYDAFSRLWLEDVYADDAYNGMYRDKIAAFLHKGGLSTLLVLSPTGEWPSGGRSGMHNWTDAQAVVICEINANYWKQQHREDVAGAFKRAAHLAYQSMARWQRPTGELWIVKNRAEPSTRLAYESYSNHSQYNLLPMAMLAIAYTRADETIVERPSPSEVGGYVFDARQTFHKIAAAAAGYYVLIDTNADPHYNSTGLQRVHKAGVLFPTLSDSTAGDRAFGPSNAPKAAIAPGIQWKSDAPDSKWQSLADFGGEKAKRNVQFVDLKTDVITSDRVAFTVTYHLSGRDDPGRTIIEKYLLNADGVRCDSSVSGDDSGIQWRVHLPILMSDGAAELAVKITGNKIATDERGSLTAIQVPTADVSEKFKLQGPRIVHHNGYVQEAAIDVKSNTATWLISLSQNKSN